MGLKLKNNANSLLTGAISSTDVGLTVTSGTGDRFPVLGANDYFYATIQNTNNTFEIVKVTARAADTMTIVRGQEGTAPISFQVGSRFELRVTASSILDFLEVYVHRVLATAGQTVFSIPYTYIVGTGALTIFVNGLRLDQTDFTETNSNTVTFTNGLALNDLVVFIINANILQGSITGYPASAVSAFGASLIDDADAAAARTTLGISAFGSSLIDDADAAAARTTLNAQALDATLTALAGLTTSAGDYIEATGSDAFRMRKLTVATYAALTAIPAASRHDDMLVYVASRSADGDGGEGWWRFDAGSSATANGGTILAPDAGSGRWLRQYSGAVNVRWFGATGDGVTDDTAAIQAAFDAAAAARDVRAETYVEFGPGRVYLVSATINVLNVSINGNGGTLLSNTPITIMEINGNNQMYTDFNLRFGSEQSNPAAIALKLTDGVQQASKNTYTNVATRNAYIGFYNDGGSGAAGSIWGSIFQNCRADYCYDWAWYFDAAIGATTCHFDTCSALGSASGSQSKGFYINNINEVTLTNVAVDQVDDGRALEISTVFQVSIDNLALESCVVTSANQHLVLLAANSVVEINSILNKVCTYDVGAGNSAYILKVSTGSEVRIGSIRDINQTVTSGTVYKIRSSTTARIRTQDVPFSQVNTLGYDELFFDFGRFKGLATASPAGVWTGTYEVGDIAWNRAPTAGGVEPIGWVCTVGGTPGTWAGFGTIA